MEAAIAGEVNIVLRSALALKQWISLVRQARGKVARPGLDECGDRFGLTFILSRNKKITK
jgi:hypothetical protein